MACKKLEFVLTLRQVINTSIYVDTVACKELEFMSTLWLVKHLVFVYTVVCTELECVDTVASNKYWCLCRHSGS